MYDDVLVPTDGSDGALDALEHAVEIAEPREATVHALFVVNRRLYVAADDGEQSDVREELREDGQAAVDEIAERAAAADLRTRSVVRDGIPHREILEYAEEAGIDLIAMGTHGRTGRDRLVSLGSVAERVVESAEIPVLTVRISEDAEPVAASGVDEPSPE